VAARHFYQFKIDLPEPHLFDHLSGKFRQECSVAIPINKERFFVLARVFVQKSIRRNHLPGITQLIELDMAMQSLADMVRRKASPDHISKNKREKIEYIRAQPFVMSASQKRIAGAQACSDNPKAFITLSLQLVQAGAGVNNGLARRVHSPGYIRRNSVVRAVQFGRHAHVMIGKAEPQSRYSQNSQRPAKRYMLMCLRIPVRQHQHRPAMVAGRRKPLCVCDIVFSVRRLYDGGELKPAVYTLEIRRGLIGKKSAAVADGCFIQALKICSRIPICGPALVCARPVPGPLQAPVKFPHNPIRSP
jgi:hypothetical protein